jgi:CHAT domain-containing protein
MLSAQSALVTPGRAFDVQLAYKIYQATFGVFGDKIASKTRLSVVTNGAFTSLPPALLVTKNPSGKSLKAVDWFVRSHAITIWPSVANLKVLRCKSDMPNCKPVVSSATKPLIGFADPVFSKQAREQAHLQQQFALRSLTRFYSGTQLDYEQLGNDLPQLSATRNEVQAVAQALRVNDADDLKLGLDATETAVKQAKLEQYRIVYFATHGLVFGDVADFAMSKAELALALTFPDKPSELDDGLLSASEVAQLKLNANWVVLSACNTAAEDKPGAGALSGLARAFFYAGGRSLIVSHWPVVDVTTATLMVNTFQTSAADAKLSHAQALRKSMLAMLDQATTDGAAHPRLWAPFVVVGEPARPNS